VPLPTTVLDNRSWAELTAEGRSLIPKAAAAWTDHNAHDPGITLMELFAWLSEILIYRLDRVSASTMRAFLRLAGVSPKPPAVASTVVALRADPGSPSTTLAPGARFGDIARATVFEASDLLRISPAWLELSPTEGTSRGSISVVSGGQRTDHSTDNAQAGFAPFGDEPHVDDTLELGFDVLPAASGEELILYFWTSTWLSDTSVQESLEHEWGEHTADCVPASPGAPPCDSTHPPAMPGHEPPPPPPPWWLHYSVRTVWEYWSGAGVWKPVPVVEDRTRAFTLSGFVRLTGAADHQPGPGDGNFRLRCRLASGSYECLPRIAAVAVNALLAQHKATTGPRYLGTSRGDAEQIYRLGTAPVVAGKTQLRVAVGTTDDDSWAEVDAWDRTGPLDRHYRLDTENGTIEFGNGRAGMIPPDGTVITALSFCVGGGPMGNIPAGRLQEIVGAHPQSITLFQPFAAVGGASSESIDRAHGRAVDDLAHPVRAVTTADFEALALETPGLPIARAKAWPSYHPSYPCMQAPGVVTVVVLPSCGSPPEPGPDFLAAVQSYLDRRRPLTTELVVVKPGYAPVTVSATLHVTRALPDLAARAQTALDRFFDPLSGGSSGAGWPFGRSVMESEVVSCLNSLPGVAFVDQVTLTGSDPTKPSCVNLSLCPTDLVQSKKHQITVVED
jgi:Baseplate J-like protein